MREIKFRVWDKRCNVMREVAILHFNRVTKEVGIEYWTEQSSLKSIRVKDFNLMQYTGLTDKNGVEIYEGDIIEYIHGCRFKVVFKDWSFGWIEGDFIPFANMAKSEFSNFKVIGNIYENKELLEELNNGYE